MTPGACCSYRPTRDYLQGGLLADGSGRLPPDAALPPLFNGRPSCPWRLGRCGAFNGPPDDASQRLAHKGLPDGNYIALRAYAATVLKLGRGPAVIAVASPRATILMPLRFDKLNEILDAANVGAWQLHVPSGETSRNDALLRLLQLRRDYFADGLANWTDRLHPDDLEGVLNRRRLMLAGDLDFYSQDYRVRRADRGWVWLRGHVAVMERDSEGKVLWVHGVVFGVGREYELDQRLHAVFDRPFQFVGLLSADGILLETNRTSVRESGQELEDVIGQYFWEGPFFANEPALQIKIREGVEKAAQGELIRFEMVQTNYEGKARTVDFTLTPMRDDDGIVVNIIPEGRDISDLAQTREALRAAERRLNAAMRAAEIGLWEWDVETDQLWLSEEWYRLLLLEYGGEPKNAAAWMQIIHPDDQPHMNLEAARYFQGETSEYGYEVRMRRGDGVWRWYLSRGRATERDDAGQIKRVAGIIMDVSDRHAMEERLVLATEGGNIGLWDVQLPDGPAWFNAQYWTMLGYNPNDMPATMDTVRSLLHPDDRVAVQSNVQGGEAASRRNVELEFRMRAADGTWRWIRSNSRVVERTKDGRTARLTGVQMDVTERKETERRLADGERLESIGRLAAGVAHEINTPVQFVTDNVQFVRNSVADIGNVIQAYRKLQEAVQTGGDVAAAARAAAEAEASADLDYLIENVPLAVDSASEGLGRISTIVRSMKEFAHPDQAQKSFADLNQAVQSTLVIANNEYKYIAELETEFGELPPVPCFLGEINQVILNLLVNASHAIADVVKDTSNLGKITVRTRRDGDYVEISIADTGTGIPESAREKIFDPFFTTKEVGKGTGQGLAIARSVIVKKHGGTLQFDTECGKGTTFFIRLPINETGTDPAVD